MRKKITALLITVCMIALAVGIAEEMTDRLRAEYDALGRVLDVLDNGYPVCPSGSASRILSTASTELDPELFSDDPDITKPLAGRAYLVTGELENTKLGYVIVVGEAELVASVVKLPGCDSGVDYTLPDVGVPTNFYLTYEGTTSKIGENLYPLFYLGAEEELVASLLENE